MKKRLDFCLIKTKIGKSECFYMGEKTMVSTSWELGKKYYNLQEAEDTIVKLNRVSSIFKRSDIKWTLDKIFTL